MTGWERFQKARHEAARGREGEGWFGVECEIDQGESQWATTNLNISVIDKRNAETIRGRQLNTGLRHQAFQGELPSAARSSWRGGTLLVGPARHRIAGSTR